jgi:hypothetical protein
MTPCTDPVVDECGHTFERAAIMEVYQTAVAKNIDFLCPVSRQKIDVNKLFKNHALASAQDEVRKGVQNLVSKYKMNETERDKAIQSQFDAIQKRLDELEKRDKAWLQSAKKFTKAGEDIVDQHNLLEWKVKIQKKQLKNLDNASLMDNLYVLFYPSYRHTIKNRNIDEDDLKLLDKKVDHRLKLGMQSCLNDLKELTGEK